MREKIICFCNSSKTWGGGEKWHYDIALRLKDRGYKIIAITNKDSELYTRLKEQNIQCFPVKISNFSFLNVFKRIKIKAILKQAQASTLIINLPADLKLIAPVAKKAGVLKTIYRRGSAIPIKNKFFNRIIFKNYIDEIIANSQKTKDTILEHNLNLFDKSKIKVIYNGIEEKDVVKSTLYSSDEGELVIGNAARFVEQKNHKFLIDLASKLKQENVKFKILLAGSGKLEEETIKYAEQLQVQDCVKFLGFISEIESFMQSIDIYILPSLWEGFGYVMAEAMLQKKPVIAFNLSSNPEIIEDKQTGYLIGKNNIDEAIDKIKYFANNLDERQRMGEKGRERVLNLFTIDRVVGDVETLLK
ncbi:MAG: glycosyltransferase family 4 protein [Bacteroidales bacterium]|nr:glycosyltransferase family 4 protein [Bacteroidales bacterium]